MTSLVAHLRSNAVAYLALLVALGGTSYAAASLPKNSVGSAQIRNGAVTTSDVEDKSLRKRDFKQGELPSSFVAVDTIDFVDPSATAEFTASTFKVKLPAGKRIEISVDMSSAFGDCDPDDNFLAGLYVDGKPVPETGFYLQNTAVGAISVALGAVVPAKPGPHTLTIGVDCPTSTVTGWSLGVTTWRVARVG